MGWKAFISSKTVYCISEFLFIYTSENTACSITAAIEATNCLTLWNFTVIPHDQSYFSKAQVGSFSRNIIETILSSVSMILISVIQSQDTVLIYYTGKKTIQRLLAGLLPYNNWHPKHQELLEDSPSTTKYAHSSFALEKWPQGRFMAGTWARMPPITWPPHTPKLIGGQVGTLSPRAMTFI